MGVTITKLKDLTTTVADELKKSSLFKSKGITAIVHEGLEQDDVEKQLREKGAVLVILPIVTVERLDQAGNSWLCKAPISVELRINPKANKDMNTNLNMYEGIVEIVNTVTRITRHPGGEFFQCAEIVAKMSSFDPGLWAYIVQFTKEVML